MGEYSPKAILQVYSDVHKHIPQAVLSGVLGDAAHTYGYHRARAVLPSSDYSVQSALDRVGDKWAASALDISFPPEQMKLVSARLLAAMRAEDNRVIHLREFFGTVNGSVVTGWDHGLHAFFGGDDSWTTSDDSHLWHVHMSFYRKWNTVYDALDQIWEVLADVDKVAPKIEAWKPTTAYPLSPSQHIGLASDPDNFHSGKPGLDGPAIRAYIRAYQRRLNRLGWRDGLADGTFNIVDLNATKRFQKAVGLTVDGRVNADDWKAAFSRNAPRKDTTTHQDSVHKIPEWPLKDGQYFGLLSGPKNSIGGATAREREEVMSIQHRLQFFGTTPKGDGFADGTYGHETALAVLRFQKGHGIPQTGEVHISDWKVLWR